MPLVLWNDRFATGIPIVDEQHRTLIGIINDLNDGLGNGQSMEQFVRTLGTLLENTVQHFATEENFMALHRFGGLEGHRLEHRLLLEEVGALQAQVGLPSIALRPQDIPRFLGDWLGHHIQEHDFEYVRFLKANGSKWG